MTQSQDKFLKTIQKAMSTFHSEQISENIKRGLALKKAKQEKGKANSYNLK